MLFFYFFKCNYNEELTRMEVSKMVWSLVAILPVLSLFLFQDVQGD